MAYSQSKTEIVATHLRTRFMEGNVEGHEIVVALISMVKAEKIDIDEVAPISLQSFLNTARYSIGTRKS